MVRPPTFGLTTIFPFAMTAKNPPDAMVIGELIVIFPFTTNMIFLFAGIAQGLTALVVVSPST